MEEQGLEHQFDAPDVPEPDSLEPIGTVARDDLDQLPKNIQRWLDRFGPFEFRPVQHVNSGDSTPRPPFREIWFKLHGELEDDPRLRRALLAYVSDFQLVGTATLPHGISWTQPDLILASLDHAMWFHRDFRMDDWLLYVIHSPNASKARGLNHGSIYTRDGVLVASTVQEGLIRYRGD